VITAGIDMGTQRVKVAILKEDKVLSRNENFSGFEPTEVAEKTFKEALEIAKLSSDSINHITATGAGVDMVTFFLLREP
jgi:activator of 2-hydroxyglutaryl-CoA dehydratase